MLIARLLIDKINHTINLLTRAVLHAVAILLALAMLLVLTNRLAHAILLQHAVQLTPLHSHVWHRTHASDLQALARLLTSTRVSLALACSEWHCMLPDRHRLGVGDVT